MPIRADFSNASRTWEEWKAGCEEWKINPHTMKAWEHKNVPLYMGESTADDNLLKFYASHFGSIDRAGEVVTKGAFRRTIPSYLRGGWVGWNHTGVGGDPSAKPIAHPIAAKEDGTGLLITAKWERHPEAQAVRQILTDRARDHLDSFASIGYKTRSYEMGQLQGKSVKFLTDVDLFETSIVLLPANEGAKVVEVKRADMVSVADVRRVFPSYPNVCDPTEWYRPVHRETQQSGHVKLREFRSRVARDKARFALMEFEADWKARRPQELVRKAIDSAWMENQIASERYNRQRQEAKEQDHARWR